MSWRLAAPIIISSALLACGNDNTSSKLDSKGPVFSPSIANALRAIAADCKLEKTPTRQTRDCKGRYGIVKIELGEGERFRGLTVGLRSMILVESKAVIAPAIQPLIGNAKDQVLEAMSKTEVGKTTEVAADGARITVTAAAPVAMPTFTVQITW